MSSEPAVISSERSEGISKKIIDFFTSLLRLEGEDKAAVIDKFEHFLRKGAHMFSYLVLSVLTSCFALSFEEIKIHLGILLSMSFTLVYALSDEIHQLYVVGRAGRLSDVMIDMIGASIGLLLVFFVRRLIKSKKNKSSAVLQ